MSTTAVPALGDATGDDDDGQHHVAEAAWSVTYIVAVYVEPFNGVRAAAIKDEHLKTLLQDLVVEVTTERPS